MKTDTQSIESRAGYVRTMTDEDITRAKESRTVTFVASTGVVDRHGTVLNQKNWQLENFNRNPIIGYQHEVYGSFFGGSDPDDVIGKGRAYMSDTRSGEEQELLIDITFQPSDQNPKAEKVFQKVLGGYLNSVSVGFAPVRNAEGKIGQMGRDVDGETVDEDTFFFYGQELLETSVVNIPSNPEAVKKAQNDAITKLISDLAKKGNLSVEEVLSVSLKDVQNIISGTYKKEIKSKDQDVDKKHLDPEVLHAIMRMNQINE